MSTTGKDQADSSPSVNVVHDLGDDTHHDVKPDFESGRGYYWMKQMYNIQKARERGEYVPNWPYKPRSGLKEESFFAQVDRRLSRLSFTVNVKFDDEGRLIRDEGV